MEEFSGKKNKLACKYISSTKERFVKAYSSLVSGYLCYNRRDLTLTRQCVALDLSALHPTMQDAHPFHPNNPCCSPPERMR